MPRADGPPLTSFGTFDFAPALTLPLYTPTFGATLPRSLGFAGRRDLGTMTARASHPKGTGKTCVFWKPASSVVLCDVGSGSSPQARDWLGFSPSNQPARFFPKSLPLPHQVREVGPIAPLGPGRAPTPTPRLHGTPTLHPGRGTGRRVWSLGGNHLGCEENLSTSRLLPGPRSDSKAVAS